MAQTINADDGVISGSTGFKFTADTTGIMALQTNGTTRVTVDASGNVGIGTANIPSNKDTVTPKLIVNGAGVAGSMQVVRHTTVGGGGGIIELTSTRGSDVNSYTILQSGDGIGSVIFGGADGNEFVQAASIVAQVDGTPGDNNMPGRILFNTTAVGASSTTERMRIDSSGRAIFTGLIYHSAATMAAAGTTQGTATAITAQINNVTTGIDGTAGVILPAPAAAGLRIFIRNGSASLSLKIYPHSGGNIAGTGVNASIEIEFATVLEFIAFDTTNWYLPSAVLS